MSDEPDDDERAAWRAVTDSPATAARWRRYGLRPADLVDGAPSALHVEQVEILGKVTSLKLDAGTDLPCEFQADSADDGVFRVCHYELDDHGNLTGNRSYRDLSLEELLAIAAGAWVSRLDFGGITFDQAVTLLNAMPFIPLAQQLAGQAEDDDGLWINDEPVEMRDGMLVANVELYDEDEPIEWELERSSDPDAGERWVANARIPTPGRRTWSSLYLEVDHDDEGTIVWDVSISEDEAGFGSASMVDGSASSIAEAKAECEAAARALIREELRTSDRH